MRKRRCCAALLLLWAAACGKVTPAPAPPTAAEVFARAMKAVEAGSLASLLPLLSPAGADQVKRDLEAFRAVLADPAEGPRVLSRMPPGAAAPPKALVEKALAGDLASLLALYVAIDPHPAAPDAAGAPPLEPASPAQFLYYHARDGSQRRVVLEKYADGWKVDWLTL